MITFPLTMIGLAVQPDLREECILNQTGMVLNYAKYAPETLRHTHTHTPFLKTQDGLLLPHPPEFLHCTQRRAHEFAEKVEDGNNAAFHAADPDILEPF